jgi:hypothetical protein
VLQATAALLRRLGHPRLLPPRYIYGDWIWQPIRIDDDFKAAGGSGLILLCDVATTRFPIHFVRFSPTHNADLVPSGRKSISVSERTGDKITLGIELSGTTMIGYAGDWVDRSKVELSRHGPSAAVQRNFSGNGNESRLVAPPAARSNQAKQNEADEACRGPQKIQRTNSHVTNIFQSFTLERVCSANRLASARCEQRLPHHKVHLPTERCHATVS